MSNYDKVKIVVVGDSGVGKTSVAHLLSHGEALSSPLWTVGCALEVKLHEYKSGTKEQKTYFIDLWDVGGSSSHRNSRSVFYNGVNGVILVHDKSNKKSEANLNRWLHEVFSGRTDEEAEFDPEQFVGASQVPILVIGTKVDAAEGYRPSTTRASAIAEECGADEIFLNCLDPKSLGPGTTAAVKLSRFFDKVIARRFHRETSSPFYDRKKLYASN